MKFTSALLLAAFSRVGAFAPTHAMMARSTLALQAAVGDSLPSVELMQGFPDVKKIDVAEYAKGKNIIIVGLPGAFTPT